eukprot:tig00021374_g21090.t1
MEPGGQECAICRAGELQDRTTAHDCGHAFCYDCIKRWTSMKNVCPLCGQVVVRLRRSAGEEEEVQPPPSPRRGGEPAHEEPSLDCLDWQYFLGELNLLARLAEDQQVEIARRGGPRSGSEDQRKWRQLAEVMVRVNSMRSNFESHGAFDPRATMEELYTLQDVVNSIRRNVPVLWPPPAAAEEEGPRRYSSHGDAAEDQERGFTLEDFMRAGGAKSKNKKGKRRSGGSEGGSGASPSPGGTPAPPLDMPGS